MQVQIWAQINITDLAIVVDWLRKHGARRDTLRHRGRVFAAAIHILAKRLVEEQKVEAPDDVQALEILHRCGMMTEKRPLKVSPGDYLRLQRQMKERAHGQEETPPTE